MIVFKKNNGAKDIFFIIIIVSLIFMMQNNIFYTPLIFLIGLYVIFRLLFLFKKLFSKNRAIQFSNDFLIFNNSLLVNNIKIPIKAIKCINTSEKYAEILNLKKYFKSSVLYRINKYFNGNRIMLNNLSSEDVFIIYNYFIKMK